MNAIDTAVEIRKNMARTGLFIALVAIFLNFYDGERIAIIAAVAGMAAGYFSDMFLAMYYEDDFTDARPFLKIHLGLSVISVLLVVLSLLIWAYVNFI